MPNPSPPSSFSWLGRAVLALVTLGISLPAGAAERWVPLGPIGGMARQLAQRPSDPSRLYAATERVGLFASRDGGRSWQSIRAGLPEGYLLKLAVAPRDPDTLLATTYGGTPFDQVWHSEDGGTTWSPAARPPASPVFSLPIADFLFASGEPRTVYASTENGIFRSLDGGSTWDSWALQNIPTGALAQPAQTPATFFAAGNDLGDFHGAIYRSDDSGLTWRETPSVGGPGFAELPERLFFGAGVLYAQWSHALYSSSDGAITWSLAARLPNLSALDFAIAPSGTFYAATETGVYSSADGAHWSPPEVTSVDQASPRDGLSHLAVVSGGPRPGSEVVIAGGRRGFWRSADRGATWRPASRGIAVHDVLDLTVLPDSQGTVLGSFDEGLFRIDREGDSWRRHLERAFRRRLPGGFHLRSGASPGGVPGDVLRSRQDDGWRRSLDDTCRGSRPSSWAPMHRRCSSIRKPALSTSEPNPWASSAAPAPAARSAGSTAACRSTRSPVKIWSPIRRSRGCSTRGRSVRACSGWKIADEPF
ncbi:MAG: hypothetical protein ABJC13_13370 [Acidobacteriota bacterium]